jgi:CheY-like chemotaxis protein/anti-sigma regulatory factor (Ser/Thr protein kinase)
VSLTLDLDPDLAPIRGDGGALSHAFMNLCVNAVDAMPDHGELLLRTRNGEGGQVEVAVTDNGAGMPQKVLDRALDPFFTTKGQGKGTGLGLALVHSTVIAHRGQISIQSEPGRGTTVVLRFPSVAAPLPALIQEPVQGSAHGPLAVLLVDDDELVRSSSAALLAVLGHRVTVVASGEEALLHLQGGGQPEVVILDMNMPGLGGAGTLPLLRALRPSVPVMLATGRADQTAMDLLAADPHAHLLAKPFTLQELQACLSPKSGR